MKVTISHEAFLIKLNRNSTGITINDTFYCVSPFYGKDSVILLYNQSGLTKEYRDCDIAYIVGKNRRGNYLFERIDSKDITELQVIDMSEEDKLYLQERGCLQKSEVHNIGK